MATTVGHSEIPQFLPDYSAEFLGELQGVLDKARRFSGATGAAIAFVEGDELVTKAGLGGLAPEAGSRSPITGSFTGLCVASREVQRCDDASVDPRVDKHACAALGIASMVIVPIIETKHAIGVIAAFAPKPNAFSATHVALLRTLADIVVELQKRYPAAVNSLPPLSSAPAVEVPEPIQAPAPTKPFLVAKEPARFESPKPPAIVPPPAPKAPAVQVPVTAKAPAPPVEARIVETVAPAPVVKAVVPPVPLVKAETVAPGAKVETERTAAKIEAPRPLERQGAKREEVLSAAADIGPSVVVHQAPEPQLFSSYNTNPAAALDRERKEENGARRIIVAVAAVVLLSIVGGGWWYAKHKAPTPAPAVETSQAAQPSAPAPLQQVSPTQEPPATIVPKSEPVVTVQKFSLETKAPKQSEAAEEVQPKKPAPSVVMSEPSAIPKLPTVQEVQAPTVAGAGNGNLGTVLGMVKTAQPEAGFRSSSLTPPELTKQVSPAFPEMARRLHMKSEKVVLNATINKDGTVGNIKQVRGSGMFFDSARNAVKQWRYKPANLNGNPIEATVEIVLNFVDQR